MGAPMVEAKRSVFGLVGWNQPQVLALPFGETRRMLVTPVMSPEASVTTSEANMA